jgi:aspartate aminotransferase
LALVDEGEEVIIPTPYWVTYSELVKIAKGKVVEIYASIDNGFKNYSTAIRKRPLQQKQSIFVFITLQSERRSIQQK